MTDEEFVANNLYLITFKLFSLSYTCSPGAKLCNGSFLSIDILVKKEKTDIRYIKVQNESVNEYLRKYIHPIFYKPRFQHPRK